MLSRLPWTPKPETKPRVFKLSKDRRRALIGSIAGILGDGRTSPFEFEGECRHGLRSGLCEIGWPWAVADITAGEIVARALGRLGVKRPTWMQGQPDWVDTAPDSRTTWERTDCARCGKPLPEGDVNRFYRRYCSRLCNLAAQQEKYQRDHKAEIAARRRARRAANPEYYREIQRRYMERQPERQCETCRQMFKPLRLKQRFCDLKCRPPPPGRWGKPPAAAEGSAFRCEAAE
jgi:hypothetical protein